MSKTPRTDEHLRMKEENGHAVIVSGDFARQLETELADARAEIERLRQELRDNSTLAARQIVPAEMLVDDLTAEIERKDKLIEQMREATTKALDLLQVCEQNYQVNKTLLNQWEILRLEEIRDSIAALKAERGE